MQPGMMQPGMQPGMMQPGMQPGMMQPGMQPGMMQPDVVMMQPDMMMMQPGMMQPGMPMGSAPGAPTPGMEPFDEAKARAQAKEERAQAAKQREKMGRLKAAEVERDRKISRSSSCVIWIVAMAFIFNVLLIIPLTGQNWGYRSFTGLGIKAMHFRTSIFMMEVEVLCGKNWLEDYLCKAGVKANGKHTLQQAVGIMCAISDSACSEMNRIYIASYILLVGEVIVCLLLLAGAGCIFYYWNSEPMPKFRGMGLTLLYISPLVGIASLTAWALIHPDLAVFPDAFTRGTTMLTGSTLFGIKSMDVFPYGWCFYMTALVLVSLLVCVAMVPCLFSKHPSETEYNEWR
eukprot:CAMPEP_0115699508 /NCGR_PEP_ID=MMETSP0272-20121206/66917_1 /TAXON_ID=71861 /ORGANISM="Scrippsiella trochoidea, Strain CCMP3099" /LENGTH=344 /DNA_ID=CAMNT_0003139939 /DNA_START=1 /DNA_END=1032 /DNA_ORIENTATION=-